MSRGVQGLGPSSERESGNSKVRVPTGPESWSFRVVLVPAEGGCAGRLTRMRERLSDDHFPSHSVAHLLGLGLSRDQSEAGDEFRPEVKQQWQRWKEVICR